MQTSVVLYSQRLKSKQVQFSDRPKWFGYRHLSDFVPILDKNLCLKSKQKWPFERPKTIQYTKPVWNRFCSVFGRFCLICPQICRIFKYKTGFVFQNRTPKRFGTGFVWFWFGFRMFGSKPNDLAGPEPFEIRNSICPDFVIVRISVILCIWKLECLHHEPAYTVFE